LANKENRRAGGLLIYVCVTLFCLVFFLIYDRFSHGVRSPYMTFLFAWPLVLGVLPNLAFRLLPQLRRPRRWANNFYHASVAALTVGSVLRGIFDIAGTASDYQAYLMYAGAVLWILGIAVYICSRRRGKG
jgi:hypothetical protein